MAQRRRPRSRRPLRKDHRQAHRSKVGRPLGETRVDLLHLLGDSRDAALAWGLASPHKAPWRGVPPAGLVGTRGTAVRLSPTNALSSLLDPGFVEAAVRQGFQPLFEPALAEILRAHYPRGVAFVLNGRRLEHQSAGASEVAPLAIRVGRKRKPAGAGYPLRAGG